MARHARAAPRAVVCVIAVTLIAVLHVEVGAWVTGLFLLTELVALGAAMAASAYAFNGYGAIFFGEDMHDAPRYTAPVVLGALLAGVLIVMPPLAATLIGAPDLHAALTADDP